MSSEDVNPDLIRFLNAGELDEAQSLADALLGSLHAADRRSIQESLDRWDDVQAIANLLIFPMLIPDDTRIDYLIQGIKDKRILYYPLAALVGLGKLTKNDISLQQAVVIKPLLFEFIQQSNDLIAERASAALYPSLSTADTTALLHLLKHPNEVVRHNVLAALLRLLPYAQRRSFFESAVRNADLAMSTFLMIMDKLAEVEADAADEADYRLNLLASGLTTPLLAYIPNLSDFRL